MNDHARTTCVQTRHLLGSARLLFDRYKDSGHMVFVTNKCFTIGILDLSTPESRTAESQLQSEECWERGHFLESIDSNHSKNSQEECKYAKMTSNSSPYMEGHLRRSQPKISRGNVCPEHMQESL